MSAWLKRFDDDQWTPANGYSLVVIDVLDTVEKQVSDINARYSAKQSETRAREGLGEIDSESAANELSAFRSSLIAEAVSWASGQ
jgi:hypothetical protein